MQDKISFTDYPAVIFGRGEAGNTGRILKNRKINRVLIVTDEGIIAAGIIDIIKTSLADKNINYCIFDEIETNPLKVVIKKGLKTINTYKPDAVVAAGGGSVLDTAKGVAFYYKNPDLDVLQEQGEMKGSYNSFPVITIPTTAGTGSEVTSWAVITDPEVPEKVSIGGSCMAPLLAIIDPEMTLTLPAKLTVWTGMDAFIHALEAYLSSSTNEYISKVAYQAMEYVVDNLPKAVQDGANVAAREKMILASYLAGWAMENVGLGLVHGMSHQLGAFYHHHHGLLNAILLPYVVDYNYPVCKEKMNNINELFCKTAKNKKLSDSILAFYNTLGLKKEISIKKSDIQAMSEMAFSNVNSKTNPRTPELEDIKKIYSLSCNVKNN